jgi:hypothetical protein
VETVLLAALAVGFAAGAPFAAMASGSWEHSSALREQASQEASWRLVPAVVLGSTAPDMVPDSGGAAGGFEAAARWKAPDGGSVASRIPVPAGTRPGTAIRIWVARDGTLVQAPLRDSQIPARIALAEADAVTALAAGLAGGALLARWSLNRRRLAAWETEWRSAGPRWTTRA